MSTSPAVSAPVLYSITPVNPHAHLFRVSCTVKQSDPAGQCFSLPVWIPGSYLVREFARHLRTVTAVDSTGQTVTIRKTDKNHWQAAPIAAGQQLILQYDVYAWDLSVRGAHLDQNHGFFNGTCVFLAVAGFEDQPCLLRLCPPPHTDQWQVATALLPATGETDCAQQGEGGFGLYRATSYDELVDHPVEMGTFERTAFETSGCRYEIVLTGNHHCDFNRLGADLEKICATHMRLFGTPAPCSRYLFLTTVVGEGYGGLEHRASTALIARRDCLPYPGMNGTPEDYVTFLGLCSHEYFHTWNVKRIKPAAFLPYDLNSENYTRLLWVFEGFTSYYDELALVRSGVIDEQTYLKLLEKTVAAVLRTPGRRQQSVAESSFDAWIKYYRQDENTPNAVTSYYTKGALIALTLDLKLRLLADTPQCSLDSVMRHLWQHYGQTARGVGENEIFTLIETLAEQTAPGQGTALRRWLEDMVNGTDDPPLAELLAQFGVALTFAAPVDAPASLGIKTCGGKSSVNIQFAYEGGAAQRAGLSAGDQMVALNGLRLMEQSLEKLLHRHCPGERVSIHAFRRDELICAEVILDAADQTPTISALPEASQDCLQRKADWLWQNKEE